MGFTSGKLLRVSLRAYAPGVEQVTTFHYDLDDDVSGANDPQSLADYFRDNVLGPYKNLYRPRWSIDVVTVTQEKDPLNPTAARSQWTAGSVGVGTQTDTSQLGPSGSQMLARLLTDHVGRRFRGRLWVGGDHAQSWLMDNTWASSYQTGYPKAFMDSIPYQPDISPPGATSTAKWVVYSRTQRAANLNPYASPITSYALQPEIHWSRRRANQG